MKTVLITGAGSGIGAATTRLFSTNNYQVILLGRSKEKLELVASDLNNATIALCDLSNTHEVRKTAKDLISKFEIDVLIHNAGIIERNSFLKTSEESWRNQFETNLFSAIWLTQEILPQMLERNTGSIIAVSSSIGVRPVKDSSAYSASKAALINWAQTLALEVASHHVRVNIVSPGITDTPIIAPKGKTLSKKDRDFLNSLQPLGRLGKPEEIAEATYYLAHAEWCTGTNLIIDGGISLTQN